MSVHALTVSRESVIGKLRTGSYRFSAERMADRSTSRSYESGRGCLQKCELK